jgi:hypothetical protein
MIWPFVSMPDLTSACLSVFQNLFVHMSACSCVLCFPAFCLHIPVSYAMPWPTRNKWSFTLFGRECAAETFLYKSQSKNSSSVSRLSMARSLFPSQKTGFVKSREISPCFNRTHRREIIYCKRAILSLSSSKIWTPHPPLRPPLLGGRTHSPGGEGDGGSIFWKTRDIGLASYSE